MARFTGLLGIVAILAIAWLLSNNRKAIQWKIVGWGMVLQIGTAIAILKGEAISKALDFVAPAAGRGTGITLFLVLLGVTLVAVRRLDEGKRKITWATFGLVSGAIFLRFNLLGYVFARAKDIVSALMAYSVKGGSFVFGFLGDRDVVGQVLTSDDPGIGFVFATQVLPTIIFIATIFAVLYYLGVMQVVVRLFAKIMTRFMGASGAESTNVAAAVFMGQTEAPLTIRPFLEDMTESELLTVMVSGMATVSGAIMVAYVQVAGVDVVHLLTASIMAAPGSIALAKMMIPETGEPKTGKDVHIEVVQDDVNIIDAAGRGALDGLHLSLNVAAMLIAFIAMIYLVNGGFLLVHDWLSAQGGIVGSFGSVFPSSFDQLLGWIFMPIVWLIGIPWSEAGMVGNLVGVKIVLNEFVAFINLGAMADQLSPRSFMMSTYALCGFANLSSIAIQIGGIGALAPSRRHDLARLGVRAMIAGTLANFMTATIAGILY